MSSCQGRRVVVTGAASGMGEAATRLLLDAGTEVPYLTGIEVDNDGGATAILNVGMADAVANLI